MEKRDLTEYISRDTLERLTEEAFEQPGKKERRGGLSRFAALAACAALVVMALNFDTVYAAVRELLYFLPGSGTVTQETAADYWLPREEYSAQTEAGDYFVTCLYRRGNVLSLGVKKEVTGLPKHDWGLSDEETLRFAAGEDPEDLPATGEPAPDALFSKRLTVAIRDEQGAELDLMDTGRNSFSTHDLSTGEGSFEEELEVEDFTLDRFTLVLDDSVEFPVELYRVDPEDYILDPSLSDQSHGYNISLLPLNQRCTRFALIPTPVDQAQDIPENSYWTALTFDLTAVGEDGKVYQPETVNNRPRCQEYYIPSMPETQITTITATGILESTRYDKPVASVKLPALELGEERVLDQEVPLWNYTLKVKSAGLTGEGNLWVGVEYKGRNGDRWLNQLDLEWPDGSQYDSRGIEDNSYVTSRGGMESRAGKKTTLPITFVSVVQKGLWEFQLPAE